MKNSLQLLNDGPEKEINIFFHGYSAIRSTKELEELQAYIMLARPKGRVYLMYWESGDIFKACRPVINGAKLGYKLIRHGKRIFVLTPKGLLLNAGMFAGEAAVKLIYNFKKNEKKAEAVGTKLKKHISKIPHIKDYRLNLIGHSLGARLIHYALINNDWSHYRLEDVVFLGGAADCDGTDWIKCLKEINGKLYNIWSPYDRVLKIKPDLRRPVGLTDIPLEHSKLVNKSIRGLGHKDYWKKLDEVLINGWDNYEPSEFIEIEDFDDII